MRGMLHSGRARTKKRPQLLAAFWCMPWVGQAYWNSFSAWVIVFDTPHTSGTST